MAQTENKLRIPETLRKVKNIVGIFSAKGGVGKSAISLQIALALKDKGFKVGLVDADIYGPSQSKKLKKNSQHLYELLIGSNSPSVLSENISKIELYLANLKNKVSWNIDIDPIEL